MGNVVSLAARRVGKEAERKESIASLMDFEYTDTDIVDENGEGFLATPEAHERFRAYCATFGFDLAEFPSPEERFALWHALCGELAGYVKMSLLYSETYQIVCRRRSDDWRAYVAAVASGDREKARAFRHLVVDMSWQKKSRP